MTQRKPHNKNTNNYDVKEEGGPAMDQLTVYRIGSCSSIIIRGSVNGVPCAMLVDTGATATVVRKDILGLGESTLSREPAAVLRTVTGSTFPVLGRQEVTIDLGGQSERRRHLVLVADITDDCILGMDFLATWGCLIDAAKGTVEVGAGVIGAVEEWDTGGCADLQQFQKARVAEISAEPDTHVQPVLDSFRQRVAVRELPVMTRLITEFSDVFAANKQEIGQFSGVFHDIDVGSNAPIRQAPRRVPPYRLAEVDELVAQMESMRVIEPSSSAWASPIVLVKKKDGSTRFCIDFRRLNDVTRKDSYPLPKIDEIIGSLAGSTWYTTLDLQNGYWQIPLAEAAKEKTAFCTPHGLWHFRVMPFGLCNAPATFQRAMGQLFRNQIRQGKVRVYLDDVLIKSPSFQQHVQDLREVLMVLRQSGIKLNPRKCDFFKREVRYLGHIISGAGVSPDPDKIKAVIEWPIPRTPKEAKSFISFCSYYRPFVKGFARVAGPLYHLQDESRDFVWTQECDRAFSAVKQELTSPPVLVHPDPGARYILDVDASGSAVGATLSQKQGVAERVVAYYSKCLSKPERNYCVTRKELLSLVKALRHFKSYGLDNGDPVEVRTDHSSLTWLRNFRDPDGQLARWLEVLAPFNLQIAYRPGKEHGNADGLSRRPCLDHGCRYCARQEEKFLAREGVMARTALEREVDWGCAQQEDPVVGKVMQWVSVGERPEWDTIAIHGPKMKAYWAMFDVLVVEDGVLKRVWEQGSRKVLQIVVPDSWKDEVLAEAHHTGHFGEKRMVSTLRKMFYWVGMHQDVRICVRSCDVCGRRRGGQHPKAPMQEYVVGAPFERVAIDVMGPLPKSDSGNRFIIVVMDYFTKWPEAFPVADQTAETVAEGLVNHVISRFGIPQELHSDQGTNFESRIFQEVVKLLGIRKTRTTPMHPQSNGLVERFNRTLWNLLSKMVEEHQRDWDRQLPVALMAYRATDHASTGFSPAMMMLGRELVLPVSLLYGRVPHQSPEANFAKVLLDRLEEVHQVARDKLLKAANDLKRRYNARTVMPTFKEGEQVWCFLPRRRVGYCPKLQSSWVGPCTVKKRITDVVYRIKLPSGRNYVVHADRLANYKGNGRGK